MCSIRETLLIPYGIIVPAAQQQPHTQRKHRWEGQHCWHKMTSLISVIELGFACTPEQTHFTLLHLSTDNTSVLTAIHTKHWAMLVAIHRIHHFLFLLSKTISTWTNITLVDDYFCTMTIPWLCKVVIALMISNIDSKLKHWMLHVI